MHITVDDEEVGQRLDAFVAGLPDTPSRNQVQLAIRRGEITVNGETCKASYALRPGDCIAVDIQPPEPCELIPQDDIEVEILHEDARLIVVNKPSGLVVHPAPGHPDGTLVNALLSRMPSGAFEGEYVRPGIVHRLDRETSGVMVVARDRDALTALAAQFAERSIGRSYQALVHGPGLADSGCIETWYGRHPTDRKRFTGKVERGKRAITEFEVLERFERGAAHVRAKLRTGRTHQIRVHLSEAGAPLLGDGVYGGRAAGSSRLMKRTALHARELGFEHPDGGRRHFVAEPPEDFSRALERLRSGAPWR